MNRRIRVSIAGGSGFAGGELLRLLLFHKSVEVKQVSSDSHAGRPVSRIHPNLRSITSLKFCSLDELEETDILFIALPHKTSMYKIREFMKKSKRIIDLSGDFRLKNPDDYIKWYGIEHPCKNMLEKFEYGIAEVNRENIKKADYVACAGCNATSLIIPLYPVIKRGLADMNHIVAEVKAGTSQAGNKVNPGSHHAHRSGSVRSYKPYGHRHCAEMHQVLGFKQNERISFTAGSIDMVRGIHAVAHVFLTREMSEKELWQIYREDYGKEPFVRIVKERDGIFRFPDPKIVRGTNYADIGFCIDQETGRAVIFCAIDNLVKGASGQGVQAMNLMMGFDEKEGLDFPGLHPC